MSAKLEALSLNLKNHLGDRLLSQQVALGEVTIDVDVTEYFAVMQTLRDEPELRFEQLMDLCGVDYSTYKNEPWEGKRFAAVSHLTSITHNWRLRVRCFAPNDDFPSLPSIISIWNAVGWFEREAFDLFGILFKGHPDLRRLLTDYGFIGHPFRKDFPVSGNVEVRYDPEKGRVVYQPVSIEPRVLVPKVIRSDNRYAAALKDAKPNG
jgi:NADH-quinone oxidoreductase subunit C